MDGHNIELTWFKSQASDSSESTSLSTCLMLSSFSTSLKSELRRSVLVKTSSSSSEAFELVIRVSANGTYQTGPKKLKNNLNTSS